ncbi:hypothetical protein ABNIH16_09838, partial [Acinetobacter baumannii ABNIH16]
LKRGGMVYVKVVPDTKSDTLMPVITRKVAPDSVVYTDSYRSYNVLDVNVFIMSELTILKILQKVEIILMV